jgi:hypothetical protein
MPTKKAGTTKSVKAATARAPVPPYGIAIKEAVARGNSVEMRKLAASTRKWLNDVQSALEKLEKAISQK